METPLKILILEDLKEDIWLVKRVLSKDGMNYEMQEVDTREDFIHFVNTFMPNVILSDHSLPQFNSIEALKICRENGLEIPFILVTGTVSEEFAVNCLKQGADDYVLKSNLERLPTAIRQSLKQYEDDRKRKEAELKLRHQNEELIKINNELDSFVYNISHNLRAPLLSTLGLVKLAKMEMNVSNYESVPLYCDKIEDSVLKLDETLKEILDYSRNARSEITFEKIDFHKLINDCFSKMKYLPNSSDIETDVAIEEEVAFFSDRYRLQVIFNNLISNAIKYCDQGKEKKWIKINIHIDPDRAKIIIRDNGIGIDKDLQPKIFGMFYRATEKSQGSGLGLYIVKEDVEKLRGNIQVSSQIRTETCFEINLPNQVHFIPG